MIFAFVLLHQLAEEERNEQMYQRCIKLLTREDRKRRDRRIPRSSLRLYCQSPFRFLFDSGNDQALINATGLDHEVFNDLLRLFEPLADNYCLDQEGNIKHVTRTRKGLRKGRHRSIDATGLLGLVLLCGTGREDHVLEVPFLFLAYHRRRCIAG